MEMETQGSNKIIVMTLLEVITIYVIQTSSCYSLVVHVDQHVVVVVQTGPTQYTYTYM